MLLVRCRRSTLSRPWPAHLAPHRTLAFRLGSPRGRSISRSASTRPRSRTCRACSTCAPRVPWPPTALSRTLPERAACVAATQRLHASRAVYLFPRRQYHLFPPFDSAVRDGVQPAAQLRHVQGHDHGKDVRSALRACPGPPSLESWAIPVHAGCVAATQRPHASRAAPRRASHARLLLAPRSPTASQPRGRPMSSLARALVWAPNLQSSPPLARRSRPMPSRLSSRTSTLGSARRRSTSRSSTSIRPGSQP